jgi:hypothetical protein
MDGRVSICTDGRWPNADRGLRFAEVVVCIVADGRKAIHPRILDW